MIQAVRYTLWVSAPFNLLAAYMVLLPLSALGRLVGMPPSPPLVYSALLATMIALFGLAYAWLATQPEIDRPLVGLAAIAKTMVFVIALLLWLAERRRPELMQEQEISAGKAVLIGIVQGLAILPGISRSGSTIACGLLAGFEPKTAARFSFILSIPAISGAALLNLKEIQAIPPSQFLACACGALAALVTGLLALKLLLMIIEERQEQQTGKRVDPMDRLRKGLRPEANARAFWQVIGGVLYIAIGIGIVTLGS
jgi:undecaprenyl pyrophosphate phosphatase UppP